MKKITKVTRSRVIKFYLYNSWVPPFELILGNCFVSELIMPNCRNRPTSRQQTPLSIII